MKYFAKFLPWSIVVVLILLFYLKSCQNEPVGKTEQLENEWVVGNTDKSDSLAAVIVTLKDDLVETNMKDSVSKIAANRLIKYWKTKATNSGKLVDSLINSNPFLTQHEADNDSLISHLENRIDTLEIQKETQWRNFNKVLAVAEEQLKLEQETKNIIAKQRDRFRKQAKKRFVVGPVVSIDYQLKPSIGVGVTYRLLRF